MVISNNERINKNINLILCEYFLNNKNNKNNKNSKVQKLIHKLPFELWQKIIEQVIYEFVVVEKNCLSYMLFISFNGSDYKDIKVNDTTHSCNWEESLYNDTIFLCPHCYRIKPDESKFNKQDNIDNRKYNLPEFDENAYYNRYAFLISDYSSGIVTECNEGSCVLSKFTKKIDEFQYNNIDEYLDKIKKKFKYIPNIDNLFNKTKQIYDHDENDSNEHNIDKEYDKKKDVIKIFKIYLKFIRKTISCDELPDELLKDENQPTLIKNLIKKYNDNNDDMNVSWYNIINYVNSNKEIEELFKILEIYCDNINNYYMSYLYEIDILLEELNNDEYIYVRMWGD